MILTLLTGGCLTPAHTHTDRHADSGIVIQTQRRTDIFFQRNPAEMLVDGRHDSIMFLTTKPELIENTSSQQGRNAWHTVGFPYIGRHFHSWIRVHNILAATFITITTCTCSNVPAHYRVTDITHYSHINHLFLLGHNHEQLVDCCTLPTLRSEHTGQKSKHWTFILDARFLNFEKVTCI